MRHLTVCAVLLAIEQAYAATINVPADQPTIQAAIDAAASGDVVIVAPGTYSEQINYNGKAITIRSSDGAAATTINGGGTDRAVRIQSGESQAATLDGFTITGGGVYVSSNARPAIKNCAFSGNTGQNGPAMRVDWASPTVMECVFSENVGTGIGAVIVTGGGQPVFRRCTFKNNQASPTLDEGDAGALWLESRQLRAIVEDCVFEGNQAWNGGAVRGLAGNGTVLRRCTFRSNHSGGEGGAVTLQGTSTMVVQDCRFENNSSSINRAGGLDVSGAGTSPRVERCWFTGNTSDEGAALLVGWNARCDIADCDFAGNAASSAGGALSVRETGTVAEVQRCRFRGNHAIWGGAARVDSNGLLNLTDCVLSDNLARNEGGGAIGVWNGATVAVTRCAFRGNTAAGDGGALQVANSVSVSVIASHFESNSAYAGGAVDCIWGAQVDIQDSTFLRNMAEWGGGVASHLGGHTTLLRCQLAGNTANSSGGGIFAGEESTSLAVRESRFEENVSNSGGGIRTSGLIGGLVENCVFLGNTAWAGGAYVCASGSQGGAVRGCVFIDNMANDQGGAIGMWDQSNTLDLFDCTIADNVANRGGAIWLEENGSQTINIVNSILYGNVLYNGDPDQIANGVPSAQYSLIQGGWPGPGNIDADPLFADPAKGDYRLRTGSPCIDTGNSALVPSGLLTDAEGGARILDAAVDMGAYEYGNLSAQNVTTGTRYATLAAAVTAAQAGQEVVATPLLFSMTPTVDFGGKGFTLRSTGTIPHETGTLIELPSGASLKAPLSLPLVVGGTIRSRAAGQSGIEVGLLQLDAGGRLIARQGSALDINTVGGLTLDGDAWIESDASLTVVGDINNFGTFDILSGGALAAQDSLNNEGTVVAVDCQLDAGSVRNGWSMYLSDALLVAGSVANTEMGEIVGYGEWYCDLSNAGEVITTADTTIIGDVVNEEGGQIRVQNGSLTLIGSLTDHGSIVGDVQTVSAAALAVLGDLSIGAQGALTLPSAGWTLSVTQDFDSAITSAERLDLRNATLLLDGAAGEQTLEVMSTDIGASLAGLDRGANGRYPIGTVRVSGTGTVVRLIDDRDNDGMGQTAREALYVDALVVDSGAVLNTDACKVYYRTRTGGGTITTPANAVQYCLGASVPADFQNDCDVDSADLQLFAACVTGSRVPYNPAALPPGCELTPGADQKIPADFDKDGDVDMDDFGLFQRCYSGAGTAVDPDCGG